MIFKTIKNAPLLLQSFISYQSRVNSNRNHSISMIKERENQRGTKFRVFPDINEFTKFLKTHLTKIIQMSTPKPGQNVHDGYLTKSNRFEAEKTYISLGLFEILDQVLFEVKGGDSPEIFVRINSKLQIENTIRNA